MTTNVLATIQEASVEGWLPSSIKVRVDSGSQAVSETDGNRTCKVASS